MAQGILVSRLPSLVTSLVKNLRPGSALTFYPPRRFLARDRDTSSFVGKWVEQSKEGFDNVAEVAGLSGDALNNAKNAKGVLDIAKDGNNMVVNQGTVGDNKKVTYQIQFNQDYTRPTNIEGVNMKCRAMNFGNRIFETCESTSGPNVKSICIHQADGDQMVSRMTFGPATMKLTYKKE